MEVYLLLLLLLTKSLFFQSVLAIDFVFNGFNSSDLLLYGNATLESRFLSVTNDSTFSIGRALYPFKIRTRFPNSSDLLPFSTSFIFSITPSKNYLPGHGFVFIFTPSTGIEGTISSQFLGLFNFTNNGDPINHVFGIEFDTYKNEDIEDPDGNHIGVDLNSLTSITAQTAGFWKNNFNGDKSFMKLKLNSGVNYQVWVDYSGLELNITMARAGMRKPLFPLINVSINLSDVLFDEMYVGFCGSTGMLVETHRILAWSYSNSNFSIGEALITSNLPSFVPLKNSGFPLKAVIAVITVGIVFLLCFSVLIVSLFLIRRKRRRSIETETKEEWESEYWPHRISYRKIYTATKGFSEENVIGFGGNGKVYKGVLSGGVEIAVKLIPHENKNGMREFVAEISSLGRLKHRNLVGFRGWCKREKGSLILVYDYMENGSLDKRVFECEESLMLNWENRVRILKDVAVGVLYLHEGWKTKVLHRDINSSNVLLDREMNGRLGDFGLARMYGHDQVGCISRVVGTVGYIAPELIRTGRASPETDVFGFGVLVLEVVCGRRPIEDWKPPLVEWVWGMMDRGELVNALDERLRCKGGFDEEEVERVLRLGLLCVHPNIHGRPTMRQVVKVLEGAPESDMFLRKGMEVYHWRSDQGTRPSFDEIQQLLSCSISLSPSDLLVEGR